MDEREKAAKAAYWDEWSNSHIGDEAILAACKKYAALGDQRLREAALGIVRHTSGDSTGELWTVPAKYIHRLGAVLDAPARAEPPAQPEASTDDVVERMLDVFSSEGDTGIDGMTAALAVAREGYAPVTEQRWTREQIEEALRDTWPEWNAANAIWSVDYFVGMIMQRITAKPETVTVKNGCVYGGGCLICEFHGTFGFDAHERAESYAASLRAELEKEEAK